MKTTVRIIVGASVGALSGAVFGAALFSIPSYMNTSSSFLGTGRDWTTFAMMLGAMFGSVPGLVIGLTIGITRAGKARGVIIGAIVGLLIAAYALSVTTRYDNEVENVRVGGDSARSAGRSHRRGDCQPLSRSRPQLS